MDESKRIYKDSLFRMYFKETENFAQLCNAVTGLNVKAEELTENTVDEILFDKFRNDVSFSAGENCFVFFEHQSTRNLNMPLRMLFYLSMLYRPQAGEDFIYRTKMIHLPAPKFFVFYNGKEPYPEEDTQRLSDSFSMKGDIELTVKIFNINYDKNFRLIRTCRPIHDYSCFVDRVETNRAKGMIRRDAIIESMEWCREQNIMSDFLTAHWWEVFEMVSLVWNEDRAKKFYTAEARAEGRAEGIAEGRAEGIAEGRAEGRAEALLGTIRALMDSLHLTAEAAMNAMKISPEMQRELAPLI